MPYYVYVIELDKKILQSKKFTERNPNLDSDKPCFYVGQTCHDPDTRFKQHKDGYKSNSFVRKYGLWLRRRKFKRFNPIDTREEAERIEKELSEKLRRNIEFDAL